MAGGGGNLRADLTHLLVEAGPISRQAKTLPLRVEASIMASGSYATIPGGYANQASGSYSFRRVSTARPPVKIVSRLARAPRHHRTTTASCGAEVPMSIPIPLQPETTLSMPQLPCLVRRAARQRRCIDQRLRLGLRQRPGTQGKHSAGRHAGIAQPYRIAAGGRPGT